MRSRYLTVVGENYTMNSVSSLEYFIKVFRKYRMTSVGNIACMLTMESWEAGKVTERSSVKRVFIYVTYKSSRKRVIVLNGFKCLRMRSSGRSFNKKWNFGFHKRFKFSWRLSFSRWGPIRSFNCLGENELELKNSSWTIGYHYEIRFSYSYSSWHFWKLFSKILPSLV
jgi:hypothetical protein